MVFDDYYLSKTLVEKGLTRVNFSIHSHLSKIEDYLIQVKWWLKRKLKAIDNFNKLYNNWLLRDALSINIVVNKQNYKTIVETVLFFYIKKNIKDIRINFIWLNRDVKESWDDLKFSYTEFLPYLKKLIYLSLKYNFRLTFDTIPACIFYKIDNKNYKNLIKKFLWEELDHITEIDHINNKDNFNWQARKKDLLKTQFTNCKYCIYREKCQWVRKAYPKLYKAEEFIPIFSNNKIIPLEENNVLNTKDNSILDEDNEVKISDNKDIKYYYEELDKWNFIWLEKEILSLYNKYKDEKYSNLYSVFLSKQNKYEKANIILLDLLKNWTEIRNKWDIYYNLAINYLNLWDKEKTEEYLLKAKKIIWDKEYFKEFYNNFFNEIKDYYIDNFRDKIIEFYKSKDKNVLEKYLYIENLINNLK